MKDTPTPLWIFAVVGVLSWVVALTLETNTPLPAALGTSAIGLVLVVLLLRGSRVVWTLFTLEAAFNLLTAPFFSLTWRLVVIGIFGLGCLLAPSSRRFVWRPRPPRRRKKGRSPASVDAAPDLAPADRSRGWYLDPDDPERMRYWMGEELGWSQKSVRGAYKAGSPYRS